MARRKNGGVIGQLTTPRAGQVSGVFSMDEVSAYTKDVGSVSSTERHFIPPNEWPTARGQTGSADRDPYYNLIMAQISDLESNNWMGKDQSIYGWDDFNSIDQWYRWPLSTYYGPRYNDWSTHFGEGGYYIVEDKPELRFLTNPFTIEFWIRLENQRGSWLYAMGKSNVAGNTANGSGWQVPINNVRQIGFHNANGAGTSTFTTTALVCDQWYHVAMVRSNTAVNGFKIYLDGVARATGTVSSNIASVNNLIIGRDSAATGTSFLASTMSDIRISNVAIYDTDFAVPTSNLALTASTTVFSHSMRDRTHGTHANNHPQGHTVTQVNQILRMVDGPLRSNANVELGDGYSSFTTAFGQSQFNIHDERPTNTSLRFGIGNYTVEAWINRNDADEGFAIAGKGTLNIATASATGWNFRANTEYLSWDDGVTVISGRGNWRMYPGDWHHVAAVREGTGAGQFRLYVDGVQTTQTVTTLATNYTQTSNLRIGTTRSRDLNSRGWMCGFRISNVARYTGNTLASTEQFVTNSMTVDSNTLLLLGTTGNTKPRSMSPTWTTQGTAKHLTFRHRATNEHRGSSHTPIGRDGAKCGMAFYGTAQNTQIVSSRSPNKDLVFGTGDFSIEFWMSTRYKFGSTDYDYLLDMRSTYNDNGIAIRYGWGWYEGIHVITANTFLLGDSLSGQDIRQWRHVCVQRTNGAIALYVNGKKSQETTWTANVVSLSDRVEIGNSTRTTIDYGQNFGGYMADLRICKGTVPYAVGGRNPDKISVPQTWLTAVPGTVIQHMNFPITTDRLGRGNYYGWNTEQVTSGFADAYPYAGSPYNPTTEWTPDDYSLGDIHDSSAGWTQAEGFWTASNRYNEFAWISRMVKPWTIECWFYMGGINFASFAPYTIFQTATTAGNEGFQLLVNYGNGANSAGNLSFRLWTAANSGVQQMFSTESAAPYTLRYVSWNYVTVQFDPTRTNVLAMFLNGVRIATRAAFNPVGSRSWNTNHFVMQADNNGTGPCRVSTIARYNNDLTTMALPTARFTYDQFTYALINSEDVMGNEVSHKISFFHYSTLPSTYAKFGKASLRFSNKDNATTHSKINANFGNFNVYPMNLQYGDFTFELWAAWQDINFGGRNFTATTGNVLCQLFNCYRVSVTDTGLWNFRRQSTGTVYQVINTTKTVATRTSGNWDHIVMMRKSGNIYCYVNGEEVGVINAANSGTYASGGPTVNIADEHNGTENIMIGTDNASTALTGWTGWVQDLRFTAIARYTTKVINGVPTMVDRISYLPALPRKLNPTR